MITLAVIAMVGFLIGAIYYTGKRNGTIQTEASTFREWAEASERIDEARRDPVDRDNVADKLRDGQF